MNHRASMGLAVVLSSACAGAELEGAVAIAPETEPSVASSREFLPLDCTNERGVRAAAPPLRIVGLTLADGRERVVERRHGYDSVLVSNAFATETSRVFQYVSDDGNGHRLLHALSFETTWGKGQLTVSDLYERETSSAGFRGEPSRVTLRCALRAVAASSQLDTPRAVE